MKVTICLIIGLVIAVAGLVISLCYLVKARKNLEAAQQGLNAAQTGLSNMMKTVSDMFDKKLNSAIENLKSISVDAKKEVNNTSSSVSSTLEDAGFKKK